MTSSSERPVSALTKLFDRSMQQFRFRPEFSDSTLKVNASSAGKSWSEMAGVANRAGGWRIFKSSIL